MFTICEDTEILFTSNDSFELLRVLEEVMPNATFAPMDYLLQLSQYLRRDAQGEPVEPVKVVTPEEEKRGMSIALRKMEEVRLALARNLARALVSGFDNPF